MSDVARLRLKRHEDRRLRAGHPWVFSNEIETGATPLVGLTPGVLATIESAAGEPLVSAYVNPHSLITARVVGRPGEPVLDRPWFVRRLRAAAALRARIYREPFYRLVFGESDGLPGLVVDRYADWLVVQVNTAGMAAREAIWLAALDEVMRPQGILLRNDTSARELEGLVREVRVAHGSVPDEVILTEDGCRFPVALHSGQKTGWYFDQRSNRARLGPLVAGARVLDLYCYLGAWSLAAARAGAREVVAVDSSGDAIARVRAAVADNGQHAVVTAVEADVPQYLQALRQEERRFDVVILDPPAFIRRRRDAAAGISAYRRINQLAASVLADDGLLISSSCSQHLERETLEDAVVRAARRMRREAQWLDRGGQSPDHPVHPSLPETAYLKTLFARLYIP